MREVNLLDSIPRIRRPIAEREAAVPAEREVARRFGREYFDGHRGQGYGGYRYDGRWLAVARRMCQFYDLKPGAAILDVGCAKGFLLHDFTQVLPHARVTGLERSAYAIETALEPVRAKVIQGSAEHLPFPDASFDLVLSINVVHNLEADACRRAIAEMERVSRRFKYLQVDSFLDETQRDAFERWVLTALTYYDPAGWVRLFREAGYTGDYFWTITE